MKKKLKTSASYILFFALSYNALAQDSLIIDYPGTTVPGNTPILFAPDIVGSTAALNFRPDGQEFYFTQRLTSGKISVVTKYLDGEWTTPEQTLLHYDELLSDGTGFYYDYDTRDIYTFTWTPEGQSLPEHVYTTSNRILRLRASLNKNLYFSDDLGDANRNDIYICKYENGQYLSPERLPNTINSSLMEEHCLIAPDESFIIFDVWTSTSSTNPTYISYRKPDGKWTNRKKLGMDGIPFL